MAEKVALTSKTPGSKRENSVSQTRSTDFAQTKDSHLDSLIFLQRGIGNQTVQKLLRSGVLQAKLRICEPKDVYEQEADRVAEQVMRMPEPIIQSKPI